MFTLFTCLGFTFVVVQAIGQNGRVNMAVSEVGGGLRRRAAASLFCHGDHLDLVLVDS